ncbi:MAG: sigma-70 family RNA polymerase sigma factor [Chloroflexi bacterium]|nr:sigma-70 family RNA polymerase sigma factor [Chloroflexota bacterium]
MSRSGKDAAREDQTTIVTTNKARAIPNEAQQANSTTAQFDATFLEHWTPICRVLVRLVDDHAEAQDLALETFWRLYEHAPRDQSNLGGWLYRVATNLGLNALRARKRRQRHELDAGRWEIETRVSDPAQIVAAEEERARVRVVLATMDARQAQLLTLRYSGLSYAELAAALNIAPASVGTLLARAEREFESRYRQAE